MGSPEEKTFIEPECLLDMCSREDLQLLLTEDEAWNELVAEADLSREEEDALREALSELLAYTDVDDEHRPQNYLQDREMFLRDYPQVKQELTERIRKLHALADKVDKVHRDCTISKVVANTTGAVSGVLTILGFALAPVTAGGSLMLSATGMGLGAAAAVTSVSTSIVEQVNMSSAEAEAKCLVPTSKNTVEGATKPVILSTSSIASLPRNCFQNLQRIRKNIRAIQLAKANPRLAANAKRLMTTGRISARSTKQVQRAFGGTALAMTKGARIMGAATAGVFLLMDVVSLVKESKHLQEGAKAESAAELRRQAWDLEQKLQKLNDIYDLLK
ncbi:apolipoprotein L2-like isoform X1 [Nannospalax galili]|uniref:apolipoprotein L2-like isoform X1 n=1 Tax=Nannospalax galili TaxID=1026970 RepID=UPI000819CD6F|nr:apolipoprotein L2-like isoform X1 [Nannospalax galili]